MIKIYNIYDSTTWSLLPQINIYRRRENIQHSMLYNTDLNYNSIDTYKQEIFPTFILAYCIHITRSLN